MSLWFNVEHRIYVCSRNSLVVANESHFARRSGNIHFSQDINRTWRLCIAACVGVAVGFVASRGQTFVSLYHRVNYRGTVCHHLSTSDADCGYGGWTGCKKKVKFAKRVSPSCRSSFMSEEDWVPPCCPCVFCFCRLTVYYCHLALQITKQMRSGILHSEPVLEYEFFEFWAFWLRVRRVGTTWRL